jgi:hypothetical protein
MSVPIYANAQVRKAISAACKDDNVAVSGNTQRFMTANGVTRKALLSAVVRHLDERREVHAKFHDDETYSYHGSLALEAGSSESVYFEVKLGAELVQKIGTYVVDHEGIWLQIKEHNKDRKPLSREVK